MINRAWVVFVLLIAAADAAEPGFAKRPEIIRDGDRAKISFAVTTATDVEVAVLAADGKVVKHLAAGVLGASQPPPAPLQAGLSQELTWDGNDDAGKPAQGGPFQARVRAGLQVKFGRTIGGSPYTGSVVSMPFRAPVNGLVVDGEGNLYVKLMSAVGSHGNSGMWPWQVRKFNRQGDYLSTLLPYPPSTAADKASGFKLVATAGRFTPANQNSLYPVFSLLGNELLSRLNGGQLVFVRSESRELGFLALDGSNQLQTVPMWPAAAKLNCPQWLDIQVALSPDGRWAYYSNVVGAAYDGKSPADIDPAWPQGRIYRHDLTQPATVPEKFFDLPLPDFAQQPYWMPSAWDKKTAAAGIDTDSQGNVLVCDLVNGQVVKISPAGKQLGTVSVPWPDKVIASRKGEAIYVISRKVSRGFLPPATLLKITDLESKARTVAELPLTGTIGGAYTLDESGSAPVIWLAGQDQQDHGVGQLIRVEDRGQQLVATGGNYLNRDQDAITFVGYMDVDREAELVYVTGNDSHVWRFQGESGQGGLLDLKAVDLAIGPGGQIYTWGDGRYDGPGALHAGSGAGPTGQRQVAPVRRTLWPSRPRPQRLWNRCGYSRPGVRHVRQQRLPCAGLRRRGQAGGFRPQDHPRYPPRPNDDSCGRGRRCRLRRQHPARQGRQPVRLAARLAAGPSTAGRLREGRGLSAGGWHDLQVQSQRRRIEAGRQCRQGSDRRRSASIRGAARSAAGAAPEHVPA